MMKIDTPREPRVIPIAPSKEHWREMTKQEQEAFIVSVNEALSTKPRPVYKAKCQAIDALKRHFRAMKQRVYLADGLAVQYSQIDEFTPDLFAVLDVEEPDDDQRMAWVVQEEGKGLDWVLEVVWAGDRKKDLVENVERYASLGIPEYFVYDKKNERLLGYRLTPGSSRYEPIIGQAGLYRSNVLGIDLGIIEGSLRFYQGTTELYDTAHLIKRLEGMVENLERKSELGEERARASMRRAIVTTLNLRNINCSDAFRQTIDECKDLDLLETWQLRALTAKSEADLLREQQ